MINNNEQQAVLYCAPEIPALSATFVYNEIFMLRELGVNVLTASVHKPIVSANETVVDKVGPTHFIYAQGLFKFVLCFFKLLITTPLSLMKTIGMLAKDILKLGIADRNSAGLVYRFLAACELSEYIKQNNIKHIHVHFAHVPTDIVMYASGITNVPYSVTAHANDIFERGYLLKSKISRSKFFATISNFNKQLLKQFDSNHKLKIVHCGVNQNKFSPRAQQPNNDIVKIGLLGRLVEKKGVHILLGAVANLKENKKFVIEIVGDGPDFKKLQQQADKLSLNNVVTFKGKLDNEHVSNWLNTLSYFVLPCVKDANGDMDGIPVSLMEAMLKGVPVISTSLSGIPELVIDNETGYLATSNCIDSLTNTLNKAMNATIDERTLIAKNAIQHVQNNFALQVNTEYLNELING